MTAMTPELDAEILARVRGIAFFNYCRAAHRATAVYEQGGPPLLLTRESDFWRRLLDVIDGIRTPNRDEQYVLDQVRAPIEGVELAKAKAAANKAEKQARLAAANTRPAMEVVS